MNFTMIEGTMIGLAILVVAICFYSIVKNLKNKNKKPEENLEDNTLREEATPHEDVTEQKIFEEEVEPIYCSACGKDTMGKTKYIKGDTQKTALCKRCYRSFMKGRIPNIEGLNDE